MTAAISIYLDNNATTPVAPECIEALLSVLRENYGNPSSKHSLGIAAKSALMDARSKLAQLLSVTPPELVFTSGGSESIHQAILGALARFPDRRRILTTQVEHSATLKLLDILETQGYEVVRLGVNCQGELSLPEVEKALTPDTALFSFLWANNETGVIFPVQALSEMARERGITTHCDAVQAVAKIPVDLGRVPLDLLSLSGHKFGAPKGVGALFIRRGLKWVPLHPGSQERGRRAGTENIPGIVALGVAAELAKDRLQRGVMKTVDALSQKLEQGLLSKIEGASINGVGAPRLPGTLSLNLGGRVPSEIVLEKLDRQGIQASPGSACSSGGTAPSHVLMAMGLSEQEAHSSLRLSLSYETTAAEVQRVLDVFPGVVEKAILDSQ